MSSASDDSTDEEYKPQGEESDYASEAESDYDSDGKKVDTSKNAKKRRKTQLVREEKRQNINKDTSTSCEKDEIEEDDEEEKQKSDELWASFLKDTNQPAVSKTEKENEAQTASENTSIIAQLKTLPTESTEKNTAEKYVTKVFDFAGEEVKVTEKVKESKPEQMSSNDKKKEKPRFGLGAQRSSGSGLAGALSQFGKKGKISVLEKSKLDWMSYKKNEGIEEELQTHNKGKDGFLERQDFLERTDVRQFERERDLRQSKRSNR